MKAVVYHSPYDVRVDTVPDPVLMADDDILLRVTATAICGSDLHLYRGRVPGLSSGDILGHEFMGVVVDAGPAVSKVSVGDRVVIPFTISCGSCFFCERELFAACETTNPGRSAVLNGRGVRSGAGMFGYTHLYGGYAGGQAELVRVPKANVGPLPIPEGVPDEKVLFLSDILPTGYQAVASAGVGPGQTVAIFGAGPVGCMAAECARMLGASRIFVVDRHAYRLEHCRAAYGAETVDYSEHESPADVILAATAGRGVDCCVDAVGFEAEGSALETVMTALKVEGSSGQALKQAIAATRRGGTLSVAGVYAGVIHGFAFGDAFEKGLTIRTGQTHVQQHMPWLLERILDGQLKPETLVTHRLPLADADVGYDMFEAKEDDCRKVILTP